MVIEWYANATIFLKIGPYILATYGLFVGAGSAIHHFLALLYINAFEKQGLLDMPEGEKSFQLAMSVFLCMFGYRLCSMYLEDHHEIKKGNYFRALARPGFLEAGGHTFTTCFGALYGGYLAYKSGNPLTFDSIIPSVLMVDALNVGYCIIVWLISLGCVTYGCCWGKELPEGTWYATKYWHPSAKVLRIRPQLEGKALFPHATLRGFLFLKNGIIITVLGAFFYIPGIFSVIFPLLNRLDKDIYYSKRGDAGADLVGFCKEENFYMVEPMPKKNHCVAWSKPDQWFGYVARICVVYWLVTGKKPLSINPLEVMDTTMAVPHFWAGIWASFAIGCWAFGYHYKKLGCWLTPPHELKTA